MTYEYKISNVEEKGFLYDYKLKNNLSLYCNNEEYFTEFSSNQERLVCYGYCFDVRNPKGETKQTLKDLIENQKFFKDLPYLNGQYILIYLRGEEIYLTSDATSLSPVFINEDIKVITNIDQDETFKFFNPNLVINLKNNQLHRIEVDLSNDDVLTNILNLTKNQFKYFYEKNLMLHFKSNNYMKALLAIMKPVLYDNYIILNEKENHQGSKKFAELIATDFNMKVMYENERRVLDQVYFARNLLFDYRQFIIRENSHTEKMNKILLDVDFDKLTEKRRIAEANIIIRKRNQSIQLNKEGLLYDPFNVHAIYQLLIENSKVKVIGDLIKELLPSINFYNFVNNTTLKEINNDLMEKIEELKNNQLLAENEQFLLESKLSYFNISENMNGKINNDEIIVYPAKQEISNEEKFIISYENPGDGMVLVKSFYKNKKNGQTIKVSINNIDFSINELYEGVLFDVESQLNITMKYKNSRNSLPWQKAGTLLVRQK